MSATGVHISSNQGALGNNVTTRRQPKPDRLKMAAAVTSTRNANTAIEESLLIDSILSQTEESEVRRMLEIEGESMGRYFPFTSTQMGGRVPKKTSLYMSPIWSKDYENPSCQSSRNELPDTVNSESPVLANRFGILNNEDFMNKVNVTGYNSVELRSKVKIGEGEETKEASDTDGRALHLAGHEDVPGCATAKDPNESGDDPDDVTSGNQRAEREDSAGLSKEPNENDQPGSDCNDEDGDGEGSGTTATGVLDMFQISAKLGKVDSILSTLGNKSTALSNLVADLKTSLEFSQGEVEDLKTENRELKQRIMDLETEECGSTYQIGKLEEKVDRVDTTGRKKNLIIDGIPEAANGKEEIEKTIWALFDHMKVGRKIDMDACYRQGNYSNNKSRPIFISFQRQADRDLVYSSRMMLSRSPDFKRVWINEDLGETSKRTRNMVRMIAKKANAEGIDIKTGKYTVLVDKVKYEASSLDELPPPLHPSSIKQVRVDRNTIAYQSEYAPFSNMFPACIEVGQRKFISLEQAYQFFKAKTLNKMLAATKIYLSRNQIKIKMLGDELGTSEEWEAKKFDIMYICLKKKYEQNEDLKEMLLKTGSSELVEATPNRLWGCGATLSSNLLRRH